PVEEPLLDLDLDQLEASGTPVAEGKSAETPIPLEEPAENAHAAPSADIPVEPVSLSGTQQQGEQSSSLEPTQTDEGADLLPRRGWRGALADETTNTAPE